MYTSSRSRNNPMLFVRYYYLSAFSHRLVGSIMVGVD